MRFLALPATALALAVPAPAALAQEPPAILHATPRWKAGDTVTYQVQQSIKSHAGGTESTRFLANGQLDIEVLDTSENALVFTWHRRLDNGEFELVREPWGIRGNVAAERLIVAIARDGLPAKLGLDLKSGKVRLQNLDELTAALRRRLQSPGSFAGDASGRQRAQAPGEQSNREPTRAQLGIQQLLVRYDNTRASFGVRQAPAIANWYARQVESEAEDLFGTLGREYTLATSTGASSATHRYRLTGADTALLEAVALPTLQNRGDRPPEAEELRATGLAGGDARPLSYEAKVELNTSTGWPSRAAITRVESEGTGAADPRTVLRRVYLRE
jgi:hypothetical protein